MISGQKVGLRAVEAEDLIKLKEWRNNPDFRRNFREVRELNSYNQEMWLQRTNASPNDFMFVFVRLEDGEVIGAGGLLYTNWIIRSSDFSFYIGYNQEYIDNDGYAIDAVSLLMQYGFNNLNLNKIWMELYEFDTRKIEFFTKEFGFKIDGTLRDNCFEDGQYWNSYIISITKADYKELCLKK